MAGTSRVLHSSRPVSHFFITVLLVCKPLGGSGCLSLSGPFGRLLAVEKALFFNFAPDLFRRSRNEGVHAFALRVGQLRQMANDVYQLPARFLTGSGTGTPRGHPGETDAV